MVDVGQSDCNFYPQALTELYVLVELGREVGRGIFGSSGAGEGNLHGVEVHYGPWHGQLHR